MEIRTRGGGDEPFREGAASSSSLRMTMALDTETMFDSLREKVTCTEALAIASAVRFVRAVVMPLTVVSNRSAGWSVPAWA